MRSSNFASDNNAPMCPEVLAALCEANQGHARGYGEDPWSERARARIADLFGGGCEVALVTSCTAANALAIASACPGPHEVLCHEHAHIHTDECGAPERFAPGIKLRGIPGVDGKLDGAALERAITARGDVHAPRPRLLSLTQPTELGTLYQPAEVAALRAVAARHGLLLHMDGARFANAVAALGVSPRALSRDLGVDVLCLGGAKNGLALGEAVVFFNPALAEDFARRCKQAGQLSAKMRFLGAQWVGLLESGAFLRNAAHANRMAALLARRLEEEVGLRPAYPCETNSVFVDLDAARAAALRGRGWRFYTDVGPGGRARFMCSFDTSEADVAALVADLHQAGSRPDRPGTDPSS